MEWPVRAPYSRTFRPCRCPQENVCHQLPVGSRSRIHEKIRKEDLCRSP
ncbi:hypothetical protein COOONC_02417 [Cooperia oncophora]